MRNESLSGMRKWHLRWAFIRPVAFLGWVKRYITTRQERRMMISSLRKSCAHWLRCIPIGDFGWCFIIFGWISTHGITNVYTEFIGTWNWTCAGNTSADFYRALKSLYCSRWCQTSPGRWILCMTAYSLARPSDRSMWLMISIEKLWISPLILRSTA